MAISDPIEATKRNTAGHLFAIRLDKVTVTSKDLAACRYERQEFPDMDSESVGDT